jgi:segregation and condensation protein A
VSYITAPSLPPAYLVETDLYEGPLDLLLALIEKAELDITRLALAQVTDQYLAYLRQLIHRDAADVSAFLVIAAKLILIKSAALLPRPSAVSINPDEQDPGEALALQLIQYRRFKQIANLLDERQSQDMHTFLRVAPVEVKVEARLDLSNITLADLVHAANEVFRSQANLTELSRVVTMPRITIREKIFAIRDRLLRTGKSSFRAILASHDRIEIVVTFLALLELIKQNFVDAKQAALFGDIEFESITDWSNESELELDFTE